MMKRTNRQYRLEQLRLREAEGTLTEQEQAELLTIFAELDAEEAEALKPAKEKSQKLQEEKVELENTVSQLRDIVTEHKCSAANRCSRISDPTPIKTLTTC